MLHTYQQATVAFTWFELYELQALLLWSGEPDATSESLQLLVSQLNNLLEHSIQSRIFQLVKTGQTANVAFSGETLAILHKRLEERLASPSSSDGEHFDCDSLHILHPLQEKLQVLKESHPAFRYQIF